MHAFCLAACMHLADCTQAADQTPICSADSCCISPQVVEAATLVLRQTTNGAVLAATGTKTSFRIDANGDPHGLIAISAQGSPYEMAEGVGVFSLIVQRSNGAIGAVTVDYEAVSYTAVAGQDFNVTSGTLNFGDGERISSITVPIIDDNVPEDSEQFEIVLSNPQGGAVMGLQSVIVATILINDDARGIIGVAEGSRQIAVAEEATDGTIFISLYRRRGLFGSVTVPWRVTRVAGGLGDAVTADLVGESGTVTFENGVNVATLQFTVLADDTPEVDEVFVLRFDSVAGGAQIDEDTAGEAMLTILQNDNANGVVFIESAARAITVDEVAGRDNPAVIPVMRQGGLFGAVDVGWVINQGTILTHDVNRLSGVVTIADGESYADIVINVKDEAFPELEEFFVVTLLTVSGGDAHFSSDTSTLSAVVTIPPNDEPHGALLLREEKQGFAVVDNLRNLQVTITRPGTATRHCCHALINACTFSIPLPPPRHQLHSPFLDTSTRPSSGNHAIVLCMLSAASKPAPSQPSTRCNYAD